jgi:hypothetical protein
MAGFYDSTPIDELRELLLCGELIHENMHEEDYAILIDNELERVEPSNEVIRLCIAALSRYESYSDVLKINIDMEALIRQHETQSEIKVAAPKRRKLKKAALIVAAVVAAILATQIVATAMGYNNLFGYIFTRRGDTLNIERKDNEDEPFDEPVYIVYESINDVPEDILALLPFETLERFEFFYGSTVQYSPNRRNSMFAYMGDDSDENFLTLNIMCGGVNANLPMDEDFFEELTINGINYSFFRNAGTYRVVWVNNDILFDMAANLAFEEVRAIVDTFG